MPQDDKFRTFKLLASVRHRWIAIPASKTLVTLLFKVPLLCVRRLRVPNAMDNGHEVELTSPQSREIRRPRHL